VAFLKQDLETSTVSRLIYPSSLVNAVEIRKGQSMLLGVANCAKVCEPWDL
jgi:hypothetical protein